MSETPRRTNWGPILRPRRALGALRGGARDVPAGVRFDRLRLADDGRGALLPGRGLGGLARSARRRPRWSPSPPASSSSTPCSSACPSSTAPSATPSSPSSWRGRPSRSSSSVISKALAGKALGQGLAGGLSALVAINLFPLVKFATGVAPCVTGTAYPLSLYYAPIAVGLSFLTVPLGARAGAFLARLRGRDRRLRWASPAALALSLGALVLLRLL